MGLPALNQDCVEVDPCIEGLSVLLPAGFQVIGDLLGHVLCLPSLVGHVVHLSLLDDSSDFQFFLDTVGEIQDADIARLICKVDIDTLLLVFQFLLVFDMILLEFFSFLIGYGYFFL